MRSLWPDAEGPSGSLTRQTAVRPREALNPSHLLPLPRGQTATEGVEAMLCASACQRVVLSGAESMEVYIMVGAGNMRNNKKKKN